MATRKNQSHIEERTNEALSFALDIAKKPQKDISDLPKKAVTIRINAEDFNKIDAFFAERGTPLATAGRVALFYLKDCIEAGVINISEGVLHSGVKNDNKK